jgi:TRAP-type mannitol/chloroaromatic compound transport system permease small subunit
MDLITAPIFFVGVALLLWIGAEWTIKAIVKAETSGSIWSPPIWPVRFLIPLGSLLLLLQGLAKSIRDFSKARTRGVS